MNRSERASLGGRARARAMTPEQRSENARKAVQARWAKREDVVVRLEFTQPPKAPQQFVTLANYKIETWTA